MDRDEQSSAIPLVLAVLATAALYVAIWPEATTVWTGIAQLALAVGLALVSHVFARHDKRRSRGDIFRVIYLLALFALPHAIDALARAIFGVGDPLEIRLLYSLQNLMIGCSMSGESSRIRNVGLVSSVFLVLFAYLLRFDVKTTTITASYGVLAVWWMIRRHWERVESKAPAGTARMIPRRLALSITAVTAGLACLAGLVLPTRSVQRSLGALVSSSGGTGAANPFARHGVGDGDQVVAATDEARSFGAADSEVFMESNMASMYDMVNDLYGEELPKKSEAAIGLAPEDVKKNHDKLSVSETAGREFSTVRSEPRVSRDPPDRRSPAMMYLSGSPPQHLAIQTYDQWNGREWSLSEAVRPAALSLREEKTIYWLNLNRDLPADFAAGTERFTLRLIHLVTNRVPAPPHLSGLHVTKLNRAGLFRWSADGMLCMDRDTIPPLTVFQLERQTTSPDTVADALNNARVAPWQAAVKDSELAALAYEWAGHLPPGYEQVQAVCAALRGDYILDWQATAPGTTDDAVRHFLCETRRGPDYLFASAAAVLLRELGFQSRLVSGFYADSANYDATTQQTAVYEQDVHFWVEVSADGKHWFPVEPTPGYDLQDDRLTWWESTQACAWTAGRWIVTQRWPIVGSVAALTTLWLFRSALLDALASIVWRFRFARGQREDAIAALRLIELRARLSGRARPSGTTLTAWLDRIARVSTGGTDTSIRRFNLLCNWALYASGNECPLPQQQVHDTCVRVVRRLHRRTFRGVA